MGDGLPRHWGHVEGERREAVVALIDDALGSDDEVLAVVGRYLWGMQQVEQRIRAFDLDAVLRDDITSLVDLVDTIAHDPSAKDALAWWVYFAARASLACWNLYTDGAEPEDTVEVMRRFLLGAQQPEWNDYPSATAGAGTARIADCRAEDTEAAAEAIAAAASFMASRENRYATATIRNALTAFEMSPVVELDIFVGWLLKTALRFAYIHGTSAGRCPAGLPYSRFRVREVQRDGRTLIGETLDGRLNPGDVAWTLWGLRMQLADVSPTSLQITDRMSDDDGRHLIGKTLLFRPDRGRRQPR